MDSKIRTALERDFVAVSDTKTPDFASALSKLRDLCGGGVDKMRAFVAATGCGKVCDWLELHSPAARCLMVDELGSIPPMYEASDVDGFVLGDIGSCSAAYHRGPSAVIATMTPFVDEDSGKFKKFFDDHFVKESPPTPDDVLEFNLDAMRMENETLSNLLFVASAFNGVIVVKEDRLANAMKMARELVGEFGFPRWVGGRSFVDALSKTKTWEPVEERFHCLGGLRGYVDGCEEVMLVEGMHDDRGYALSPLEYLGIRPVGTYGGVFGFDGMRRGMAITCLNAVAGIRVAK